jgi:ZIP family zinc transporter
MVIPRLCISPNGFSGENIMKNDRNDGIFFDRIRRVSLFVMAIALHNLPEGIAAGVGLGSGDGADAILIATAIALQNLPEGIIVTTAMLGVGVRPTRAFLISGLTGVIEIFGTFVGFFAVNISRILLPLILAIAGGTMLYVIGEEMIPETHSEDGGKFSTYFLLVGFSLMLIFKAFL